MDEVANSRPGNLAVDPKLELDQIALGGASEGCKLFVSLNLGVEVAAVGEDCRGVIHFAGDVEGAREPVAQARGAVVDRCEVGGAVVGVFVGLGSQEGEGVGGVHTVADGEVPDGEFAAGVELAATHVVDVAGLLEHHLVGEGLKCSGVLSKVECEQGVDIHHL